MDAKTWAFLRSYILDYVVGILWLLALATIFVSPSVLDSLFTTIKRTSTSLAPLALTDFAAGVLTVVASVVLPYCIAMLVKPASQLATNLLFLVQNLFWRRNLKTDLDLDRYANRLWSSRAGRHYTMSDRTKIMLLRTRTPEAADDLMGHLDELVFRSDVLLPTTILFYAVLWRLEVPHTVAIAVTISVFLIGSIARNSNANTWRRRLNIAIIELTHKDSVVKTDERDRFRDPAGGMWLRED